MTEELFISEGHKTVVRTIGYRLIISTTTTVKITYFTWLMSVQILLQCIKYSKNHLLSLQLLIYNTDE